MVRTATKRIWARGSRHLSHRQFHSLLLFLLATALLLGGCRRGGSSANTSDVRIDLVKPLFSPAVGPNMLRVQVLDRADNPVEDAIIQARADMTHAGMVPIFAEADAAQDGVYTLPLEWTMSGEWIVTIEAKLPDGRTASEQFDLTVTGDEIYCTVDR